ncbi:hypothetical protein FHE66_04600 [Georgenia sp. 311]|uniref:Septum formation-related domain-containing protein n=1 Tax=Georgenia wutianyii TaxID=2585135 RepID=A0ABX5VQ22_9MICO|nr:MULTISPECIES: septum formation family protein [Georgenia]QDB79139.1 hypothetical protein FE251_06960 [Georgenia wutianyii]TNC19192.1 hypothetical protein FHE66_04600 [Georgenia sp. 311]
MRRRLAPAAVAVLTGAALTGCSLFGQGPEQVSVFDAAPGECFLAPEEIVAELTEITRVPCDSAHDQEAYAVVDYVTGEGTEGYPGDGALKDFADGSCAAEFAGYVGVDYRDSSLFLTYLLPSARSWEQDGDREVTCFVTTTGEPLTATVRDSAL